jgi:hypothetical protein
MSKLTRRGARNLTTALDRIASALQENHAVLGIDQKIANDFAYRCDLISDAVESTAIANHPKAADENAPQKGPEYNTAKPGIEREIGAEVGGPIYEEDPATSTDLKGQFTQKDFHQLTDLAEKLKTAASLVLPTPEQKVADDYGFSFTQ